MMRLHLSINEANVDVSMWSKCEENTRLQSSIPRPASLPSATIFESTPILVTGKSRKTLTLISQLNPLSNSTHLSPCHGTPVPQDQLQSIIPQMDLKRTLKVLTFKKRTLLPLGPPWQTSPPQDKEVSPYLWPLLLRMVNLRQDWGYIPPSKYASSNFGCDSKLSRSLMPWSCSYLWWSCSGDNVEDGTMMVMVMGLVWVVCSLPRISSRLTALQLPICPPGHIVLPRNIANGTIVVLLSNICTHYCLTQQWHNLGAQNSLGQHLIQTEFVDRKFFDHQFFVLHQIFILFSTTVRCLIEQFLSKNMGRQQSY